MSFEARERLLALPEDETLVPGGRAVVRSCLGLSKEETLLLVTTDDLMPIGAAVLRAALEVDCDVTAYILGEGALDNEPFLVRVLGQMQSLSASVLITHDSSLHDLRQRMVEAVEDAHRHLQLVDVTDSMMRQSIRADYEEIHALGERVRNLMRPDSVLEVQSAAGTRLTLACDPNHRWYNASGLQRGPGWSILPGGSLFTAPAAVEGVLVPDGGVWLPDGTEIGRRSRLELVFDDGLLTDIRGSMAKELLETVDSAVSGRRVGLACLGINTSVLTPIGAAVQDLRMPGFHLSLGDSRSSWTMAPWKSDIELPLMPRRPDVQVDGIPLLVRGRYARSVLGGGF